MQCRVICLPRGDQRARVLGIKSPGTDGVPGGNRADFQVSATVPRPTSGVRCGRNSGFFPRIRQKRGSVCRTPPLARLRLMQLSPPDLSRGQELHDGRVSDGYGQWR